MCNRFFVGSQFNKQVANLFHQLRFLVVKQFKTYRFESFAYFFNAIIVLSIVTTLPVPNIVRWIIEHYQLKFPAPKNQDEAFRITEGQDDLL